LALVQAVPFPDSRYVPTTALSADGRWLAGEVREEVRLVERATGHVTACVEAGERNHAIVFDPTSHLLATACSFQGGGHVRADRIGPDGSLTPLHELQRSGYRTPEAQFVDALADIAFSLD